MSASRQLTQHEIFLLRSRRIHAVRVACPQLSDVEVVKAVNAWYRGKPGTASIREIIKAAGLL